ncbi:MAG: hypothetical protein ACP5E3_03135 [Bacteroidales bacterium]
MGSIHDQAFGSVTGTGSAIEVDIGFVPRKVVLVNLDTPAIVVWTSGMDDDKGYKIINHDTTQVAALSSGGVTPLGDDEDDDVMGFKIGTDSSINVNTQTIYYEAYK